MCELIVSDWPVPAGIHALTTTRLGGVSQPPFDSLNLGDHVGDDPQAVSHNRKRLLQLAALPTAPLWLNQTHSTQVIDAAHWTTGIEGDAMISERAGQVCAILTADCLPICLCDSKGQQIAAIHAGWRGLAAGIIERTFTQMTAAPNEILAWLGPAIGPQAFEVGHDVYRAFTEQDPDSEMAFEKQDANHFLADIYQLARLKLQRQGVNAIYGGQHCTVSDPAHFYSYRRDGKTGRMATLIWRD